MENSYADFEREKKTEIEALKTDLSDSEEAIKNNRWAYDEHLMCQQKVFSLPYILKFYSTLSGHKYKKMLINLFSYFDSLFIKISSANISNRQIFEELKCEVESLRKNYFQKKEECKGFAKYIANYFQSLIFALSFRLEDSIVQIRKKVEQAMCEKLDKFEKLKESLVDAEETIRSQMEAVIEHKLCVQRVLSSKLI